MATNNTTIAGRVYLSGTNDFQQRVPNPTIEASTRHLSFYSTP